MFQEIEEEIEADWIRLKDKLKSEFVQRYGDGDLYDAMSEAAGWDVDKVILWGRARYDEEEMLAFADDFKAYQRWRWREWE